MIRITDALFILAAIGGAVWTYQIKHEADLSGKQVRNLQKAIEREERRTVLLEADWAIATAPSALDVIVTTHEAQLGLGPMKSHQIVTRDDLPPIREVEEPVTAEVDSDLTTSSISDILSRSEPLR